jgi:hypothetical protein
MAEREQETAERRNGGTAERSAQERGDGVLSGAFRRSAVPPFRPLITPFRR